MDRQRQSRLPVIGAVVVLLLPMVYVVSYLALVWPDRMRYDSLDSHMQFIPKYRYGTEAWAERVYWPLEQVDRKLRPDRWQSLRMILDDERSRRIEDALGGDY